MRGRSGLRVREAHGFRVVTLARLDVDITVSIDALLLDPRRLAQSSPSGLLMKFWCFLTLIVWD